MLARIFLDLDDVLNMFTMTALKYVGCPVDNSTNVEYHLDWGYNIVKAANTIHPTRQFSVAEFWSEIGRDFWLTLPKSPECKWLINTCVEIVGKKNVMILSSVTHNPDCTAGKIEWIQKHLPSWIQHQIVLVGSPKEVCARPDALLIDDTDRNVNAFREAGGHAILVPKPWNTLHAKMVWSHMMDELAEVSNAPSTPLENFLYHLTRLDQCVGI